MKTLLLAVLVVLSQTVAAEETCSKEGFKNAVKEQFQESKQYVQQKAATGAVKIKRILRINIH